MLIHRIASTGIVFLIVKHFSGALFGDAVVLSWLSWLLAAGIGLLVWQQHIPFTMLIADRFKEAPAPGRSAPLLDANGARVKIQAFGTAIDRPVFLNEVQNFYRAERPFPTYYRNRAGEMKRAGVGPLLPSPLNDQRLLESMIESARLEMLRRGYPIRNDMNRIIGPEIHDEGLLIESITQDNGDTAHIVAIGILRPINRDQSALALQHGIGGMASAWNESPLANVKSTYRNEEYADPGAGVMPLFELELMQLVTPADNDDFEDATVAIDRPHDLPGA